MRRALSMRLSRVPEMDRDRFRARARDTGVHYGAAGCNYWVFEARDERGAYLEFFEAPDVDTLLRAHRTASAPAGADDVYVQVELN